MSGNTLAIDLGGTRLRAGLAASSDPTAVEAIGEWPAPKSLGDFTALVGRLLAVHDAGKLGIGIPGLARSTICAWVPNLPYLDGRDLAALFPGVAIALGNDAQFSLVAEVAAGVGQGVDDAILLAIGTGIGSAVLAGGRIVRGSAGGACSFGWACADAGDAGEDRSGWLERNASGRALDAIATRLGLADGLALIDAARRGDPGALAALEVPMQRLGTALAGAVALLDPQVLIVAGGLASAIEVVAPAILYALRRQLPPHLRAIDIRPGRLGSSAGLVGAAVAGSRGATWWNGHG